eukprot:m.35384 g.35384  ORF g.35384 m.35384 type:complete len:330 (+) comp17127_c0_seq1:94-1083(+)
MAVTLENAEQFPLLLAKSPLVAVHFWAGWATQCNQVDQVLTVLTKEHTNVAVVRVEAEKFVVLCGEHDVVAVPSVHLFKNGKLVNRIDGANVPLLASSFATFAASPTSAVSQSSTQTIEVNAATRKDITERLKELVNAAPVMLFMKGTPEEPRCGFSRKITALLQKEDVKFSSFNILEDNDVREGLKKLSEWPTYPQLYISGDLVGGLDIVEEMVASGDLTKALPSSQDITSRIKKLLSREKVMVFIKGTPQAPRCGFSRTIVGILDSIPDTKYGYYDILGDEEIRQGLKTYSEWPTYPQLYVNGELLGGLDIVKEMEASGDLKTSLAE